MQYIDPSLPKQIEGWRSPALGIDMPIVSYGHGGHPLLLFPTAAADYLENERFFLVKSADVSLSRDGWTTLEQEVMTEHKWWSREELGQTPATVWPENLLAMLDAAAPTLARHIPSREHRTNASLR